jgi:aryl-alcohol dehydrogenase-like predicted oxidoreductase
MMAKGKEHGRDGRGTQAKKEIHVKNQSMPKRRLGKSELEVSAMGLGCMGMSYAYGSTDDGESMRVLHRYVELGGDFLDTAEIYGPFKNEELLARFLKEVDRSKLIVATKFGFKIDPQTRQIIGADSSPENIRRACDASLQRLGIERIDLFYQHRVDPARPIEETVEAMAELVKAGKIRELGLSEAGAQTLRRAAKVHPIAALQSEYSLWTRDPEENGVLETCRELGIGFVAYSPLGRGFLTGAIKKASDLEEKDWRRMNPRFVGAAFDQNLNLAEHVKGLAKKKGCSPAQLALAWVMAQGEDIVPIPGTKRLKYLEDNMGAIRVKFTREELAEIDRLFPQNAAVGTRYPEAMMGMVNR